jgi:secernin
MCDTMAALGNSTKSGKVLFAKNSDRDPDEPAEIVFIPRQSHSQGETVKVTHISIPQVNQTYGVLLCKPIWIWGGEMGANEHGVTIGNETVWTCEPVEKQGQLIGMDLLRLALERGKTAREALDIITTLLEQYGQGGNCGYRHKEFYHNGFLIADKSEAWVLQTAGRYWIAEKVKDICTVSNTISIQGKGDLRHPKLIEHAIEMGKCKSEGDFDFATHYLPRGLSGKGILQKGAYGKVRSACSTTLLTSAKGSIGETTMMKALRDHGTKSDWDPARDRAMRFVCVHAGGMLVPSQSTSSLVSVLDDVVQTHWVTGSSAPCTSIFKPIFLPGVIPSLGPKPGKVYDPATVWWRHEELHRLVLQNYPQRMAAYSTDRDELEAKFITGAQEVAAFAKDNIQGSEDPPQRLWSYSEQALAEAMDAEAKWIEKIRAIPPQVKLSRGYRKYWKKLDQLDKLSVFT